MATILVLDNEAVVREPLAEVLRTRGHDVIEAKTTCEARKAVVGGAIDLILIEPAIEQFEGFRFLERLRRDLDLSLPATIVLTSLATREHVLLAANLMVRTYLLKSQFSLPAFLDRVEFVLVDRHGNAPMTVGSGPAASQSDSAPPAGVDAEDGTAISASINMQPESIDEAAELLKGLRPLFNRNELTTRLDSCAEMKALSPVVTELLRLTSNEQASIDQIVKVIKRDQAIALKVLKIANSAVYTRGDSVDSLDQAVMRIGMGSIRQTVMNMAVIDNFGADRAFEGVDPLQFWEHSIACGLIASEIARGRMDMKPDLAFTMGLLHDVGRLVYIDRFPEEYKEVFRVARTLQLPLERVESKLMLLNHADCMDRILHLWKFPKNLIDPIVFHHLSIGNMRRMASRRVEEVATLGLANRLTHALMLGDSANDVVYPTEGLCRHLRLSPKIVQHVEETVYDQTDAIKFAMLANGQQAGWQSRRDVWRERLDCSLRPLYVSMDPGLDAYRVFFSQLMERSENPPNLVVLHIADGRDINALVTKLTRAESEVGAKGLPMLVLAPRSDVVLPNSVVGGRTVMTLPTPVTIRRLVDSVRSLLGVTATTAAA